MKDQNSNRLTLSGILTVAIGAGIAILLLREGSVAIFSRLTDVFAPLLWGFALAYLLAPAVKRLEKLLSRVADRKQERPALKRAVSLTVVYLVLIALLYAFVRHMLPELVRSIFTLLDVLPHYLRYFFNQVMDLLSEYDIDTNMLNEMLGTGETWLASVGEYVKPLLGNVFNLSLVVTDALSNFFIGLVASVYMLAGMEKFGRQAKKVLYAAVPREKADSVVHWTREGHRTFGGFIGGKILDSTIIGLICYVFMLITRMPYALILSMVVGVSNIIPFFGPIVGGFAAGLVMLLVSPSHAIWYALFLLLLQQFDGNLLGPAILGDSIGISPFWVMATIIVGGKMFGFAGMLLSIPLFALLYSFVRSLCNEKLKNEGLPVDSIDYENFPPPDPIRQRASTVKPGYLRRLKALFSRKKS